MITQLEKDRSLSPLQGTGLYKESGRLYGVVQGAATSLRPLYVGVHLKCPPNYDAVGRTVTILQSSIEWKARNAVILKEAELDNDPGDLGVMVRVYLPAGYKGGPFGGYSHVRPVHRGIPAVQQPHVHLDRVARTLCTQRGKIHEIQATLRVPLGHKLTLRTLSMHRPTIGDWETIEIENCSEFLTGSYRVTAWADGQARPLSLQTYSADLTLTTALRRLTDTVCV